MQTKTTADVEIGTVFDAKKSALGVAKEKSGGIEEADEAIDK